MKSKVITRNLLRLLNKDEYTLHEVMDILGFKIAKIHQILTTLNLKNPDKEVNNEISIFTRDKLVTIIEYLIEQEKSYIKNKNIRRISNKKNNLKYYQDLLALLFGDISIEYINSLPEFVPVESIRGRNKYNEEQIIDIYLKMRNNDDSDND